MVHHLEFRKEEKLCSYRLLEKLFKEGESFFSFPFRVLLIQSEKAEGCNVQAVFMVPKRNIKSAVKRNLIRRRMREAYRLNKYILKPKFENGEQMLAVAFIFTGKEPADYKTIEKGVLKALKKLTVSS